MGNPFLAAARRVEQRGTSTHVYAGASTNRLLYDFIMGTLSADWVIRQSIQVLRNRARELVINNSTASRVAQLFSENVDGKDGILYQAVVQAPSAGAGDGDPEFDARANRELEAKWYRWCESRFASADGQLSWCEIGQLMSESECNDGEVLLRLIPGFDNPFGFAVDLLDPDQLDHTFNVPAGEGRNAIVMGVEVDPWRRPVAYHLWSNHPSEAGGKRRVRVPADQVVHLFLRRRVRQTRGVTWFAPMLVDLRNHGGYREAELIAARVASSKMGFFEPGPDAEFPEDDEEGEEAYFPMEAEPGLFERLPRGWQFKEWNPQHPTTAFPDFDKAVLRSLATGFRVSYMSLSSDLSDTSYGSGRIGLLAERAVYQALQQRRIARVETPVHRMWLRMAQLTGALKLSSFEAERYEAATWHPRPFPWIDPEKDIRAAKAEVRAGLNSLTRIAAQNGRDFEELMRERARETAIAKRYGVELDLSDSGAPAAPDPADEAPPAQNGNGTKPGDRRALSPRSAREPRGIPSRLLAAGRAPLSSVP